MRNNSRFEKMRKTNDFEEKYFLASQWQLAWRKLKKHHLAIIGSCILIIFYVIAIFSEFYSPYELSTRHVKYRYHPPQKIHFFDEEGFTLRPFVYGIKKEINPKTLRKTYKEDKTQKYPIYLFLHGDEYKLWGIIKTDLHLFGVRKPGVIFIFGTDDFGRDLFSRNIHAARVSLSIGLIGVALSFVLGCILGGISGFFGGTTDMIIQRVIEILLSIPKIPFWMALAIALPNYWSPLRIYFCITIILSLVGWCGLARVVRGKFLELRERDFVMAAKISGVSNTKIITRHLIPSFLSYLLVSVTLSIPRMILGETALSFLGIGLRSPVVSWGVLLKDAQNVQTVAMYPWLFIPGVFVILTVLAFNFLGDGLRDAADPYK